MKLPRATVRIFAILLSAGVCLTDGVPALVGAHTAGKPWSVNREADNIWRFELRPSENSWIIGDGGKDLERSEVVVGNAAYGKTVESSWTVTWEQTGGAPIPTRKYFWNYTGQWHVHRDPGDISVSPPIALDISQGVLKICVRSTTYKPWKFIPPLYCLYRAPIERGRPYAIVQQVKFTADVVGGSYKVWLDGRQIVDYHGPLGYPASKPPYLKIGIYRSHTNDIDVVTYRDVVMKVID